MTEQEREVEEFAMRAGQALDAHESGVAMAPACTPLLLFVPKRRRTGEEGTHCPEP
jgi:hypothetical protein